jgi:hypothetical protein
VTSRPGALFSLDPDTQFPPSSPLGALGTIDANANMEDLIGDPFIYNQAVYVTLEPRPLARSRPLTPQPLGPMA